MRKAFLILLLFLIFSCSGCENDKEYIRSLAIENYVDDFHPINWLLRYYARAYYSMPEDLDEFMAFISDCKEKDSFFSEVEKMEGYDVLETISNTKILFASFVDSAFFFLPDYEAGSSVIGTPRLYVKESDTYPESATIYGTTLPSVFSSSGKFIFDSDYPLIETFFEGLSKEKERQVFYQSSVTGEILPLKAVFVYDKKQGTLSISEIPPHNEMFLKDQSMIKGFMPIGPDYTVDSYLRYILSEVKTFFADKQDVYTVFFTLDFYY